MNNDLYLQQCKAKNFGLSYLAKKVNEIKNLICEPKTVLDDLHAQAIIRCVFKVKRERLITIADCQKAIMKQAIDVFAEYWQHYKRQRTFLKQVKSQPVLINSLNAPNTYDDAELKDLLNFIASKLSKKEFDLFSFRILENIPFRDLEGFFNDSAVNLRSTFRHIRQKVGEILIKEKYTLKH